LPKFERPLLVCIFVGFLAGIVLRYVPPCPFLNRIPFAWLTIVAITAGITAAYGLMALMHRRLD
tara:strand:+ start:1748 stop:1939 length:192 start_codon:yes stop_codon:yes gene_type:complete